MSSCPLVFCFAPVCPDPGMVIVIQVPCNDAIFFPQQKTRFPQDGTDFPHPNTTFPLCLQIFLTHQQSGPPCQHKNFQHKIFPNPTLIFPIPPLIFPNPTIIFPKPPLVFPIPPGTGGAPSLCSPLCENSGWGKMVGAWGKWVSLWGKRVFCWGKKFNSLG